MIAFRVQWTLLHCISSSILRPPALPPSHTKHGLATPPAIKKHSTGIRQELSLSKSKSHECELSGASREEMLMGEVGATTGTNERVDSSGYSSASEAPSATRKRLHSSEPEAGDAAHSPIASPLSPPVPPSDRLKVQNYLTNFIEGLKLPFHHQGAFTTFSYFLSCKYTFFGVGISKLSCKQYPLCW